MPKTETFGTVVARVGVCDIILKETLTAIVGETLTQFDNGDKEGSHRQVLAYPSQMLLFVVVGFIAFWSLLSKLLGCCIRVYMLLVCGLVDASVSDDTTSCINTLLIRRPTFFQSLVHPIKRISSNLRPKNSLHQCNALSDSILVTLGHVAKS